MNVERAEWDAREGSKVGRLQWSKAGVTIYSVEGSFVGRFDDPRDVGLLNYLIMDALKIVVQEHDKRGKKEHANSRNEEVRVQPEGGEGGEELRQGDGEEACH